MKKVFVLALAAAMSASAFAQNPEALKQIKKLKTVDEIVSLVNATPNLSAAETAQAYGQALDIVMKNVDKANATMQTNAAMEQMGQKGEEVDKMAFYKDLCQAYALALKCDEYDIQPNDKGKVAPKFRKKNADRLSQLRLNLINGGQDAQGAGNSKLAADCFATYGETGVAPMFAESVKGGDQYLGEVARVGAVLCFQEGNLARAKKVAKVVAGVPESQKEGVELLVYFATQNVESKADSLNALNSLKELYTEYPDNEGVFAQLAQWYNNMNMSAEQQAFISERLAKNADSFSAWALKGQNEMNAQKYDDAIESFKKASNCTKEDPKQGALVLTYIGFCYNAKAAAEDKYEAQIELIKQAIPFLEQAREIDPERERSNWAYPLYQCYYNVYGENDARTKEVEALQGR